MGKALTRPLLVSQGLVSQGVDKHECWAVTSIFALGTGIKGCVSVYGAEASSQHQPRAVNLITQLAQSIANDGCKHGLLLGQPVWRLPPAASWCRGSCQEAKVTPNLEVLCDFNAI